MATNQEMGNAFKLFGKYVKPKSSSEQLALINTGGNNYVIGLKSTTSGAYSSISSHLSKKEMTQYLWDISKILGRIDNGDLKLR